MHLHRSLSFAQFAIAFSSLIHDADHPGVPNACLVAEKSPVAIQYGNRSVAEQNSLVLCWDMLMEEKYTRFRHMVCASRSELDRFRSLVINAVLATDIVDKDLKGLRNKRWEKAFSGAEESPKAATNRKATIVIEHLIQASDVSHTSKILGRANRRHVKTHTTFNFFLLSATLAYLPVRFQSLRPFSTHAIRLS